MGRDEPRSTVERLTLPIVARCLRRGSAVEAPSSYTPAWPLCRSLTSRFLSCAQPRDDRLQTSIVSFRFKIRAWWGVFGAGQMLPPEKLLSQIHQRFYQFRRGGEPGVREVSEELRLFRWVLWHQPLGCLRGMDEDPSPGLL